MRKHPNRVIRGGSWFSDTTNLRCAFRRSDGFPVAAAFGVGFRPVLKLSRERAVLPECDECQRPAIHMQRDSASVMHAFCAECWDTHQRICGNSGRPYII